MRRSEGEEQGRGDEQKERRSRRSRAAMIYLCGSFGIVCLGKYLNFESRVCFQKKNSWGMIRGYDSGV